MGAGRGVRDAYRHVHPEGTFRAAIAKLPYLAELGVTVIEVMPVAQFGGERGWGYDGVLLYAPHSAYGTPDDFKAFIDAAHGYGLSVVPILC